MERSVGGGQAGRGKNERRQMSSGMDEAQLRNVTQAQVPEEWAEGKHGGGEMVSRRATVDLGGGVRENQGCVSRRQQVPADLAKGDKDVMAMSSLGATRYEAQPREMTHLPVAEGRAEG